MTYPTRNGLITSPGKFQGEPEWVPVLWDAALQGAADEDNGEIFTFWFETSDYVSWPELIGIEAVELWESCGGFVFHRVLRRGDILPGDWQ